MKKARHQTSPMQIELREIPAEGLDLSFDLTGDFAREALAGTEASGETASAKAQVFLLRTNRSVFAKGRLVGKLELPCSRCAQVAPLPLDVPFQVTYLPRPAKDEALEGGGGAEEIELAEEDLDFATYDGQELDLRPLLREQLLLALPMTHLCREDCKGLCAQCGKDRNEGACACVPSPRDERFAALKKLKLDEKPKDQR